ncbi:hypothetical protein [Catenulispora yoronensis]|uniref:hypothetical protein n=1 Tax=Catenulispora yoronensis TaxID=450799 RepID=UPI0031D3D5BD
MITAETSPAPAAPPTAAAPPAPVRAALAAAIDVQAYRMDQLSAAIVRATAQVAWSGRAAERFRARAAERSRECLQLAVALRASADRVQVAAMGPAPDRGPAHLGSDLRHYPAAQGGQGQGGQVSQVSHVSQGGQGGQLGQVSQGGQVGQLGQVGRRGPAR